MFNVNIFLINKTEKQFMRGNIKNGLYIIESVTFTARKYGKTIKLASTEVREH